MAAYPDLMITPMRRELTEHGFTELRSPEEVDALLAAETGTVLIAVNSICGCAAARMRPAVVQALRHERRPAVAATVFAGQDSAATERAREYFVPYPPSSPAIALLKAGELVFMLERKDIEGREADEIAVVLREAFEKHC
ncbi:MAG: BrxA/BrxB family bacilliredoxin [Longimicrobiales bacterium]